jgi:hypothetical protein
MNIDEFISYLIKKRFNDKQINQLLKIQEAGYNLVEYIDKDSGISVKIIESEYIVPTDDIEKLRQLKFILLKDRYDTSQLTEIIDGYCKNLDYEKYSHIKYNGFQMCEIKDGLEEKVDITKYNDIKYSDYQMCVLREILIYNKNNSDKGVDISLFQNETLSPLRMRGLFKKLASDNQDVKFEAYNELNMCYENNKKNTNNEYEK